jgi:hypothetical protein
MCDIEEASSGREKFRRIMRNSFFWGRVLGFELRAYTLR